MQSDITDFKTRVKSSFDRSANTYDGAALVQKEIARKLVNYASPYIKNGAAILDAGCGTGFIGNFIKQPDLFLLQSDIATAMCIQARLKNSMPSVAADLDFLPFNENSFDAILSSMTIQWLKSLDDFFEACKKITRKGGIVGISFPSTRTLKELRQTMEIINGTSTNTLPTAEQAANSAIKAGFTYLKQESEIVVEQHLSFANLMKSLKDTGANVRENVNSQTATPLKSAGEYYEKNFTSDGGVYCTWEIVYLILES